MGAAFGRLPKPGEKGMKVKILRSTFIDTKAIGLEGSPFAAAPDSVIEFTSKEAFEKWAAKAAPSSYGVIEDKAASPAKAPAKSKAKE